MNAADELIALAQGRDAAARVEQYARGKAEEWQIHMKAALDAVRDLRSLHAGIAEACAIAVQAGIKQGLTSGEREIAVAFLCWAWFHGRTE